MASVQNDSQRPIKIETPDGGTVIVPPGEASQLFFVNGIYTVKDEDGNVLMRFVLSDATVTFIPRPPGPPGSPGSGSSLATAIKVIIIAPRNVRKIIIENPFDEGDITVVKPDESTVVIPAGKKAEFEPLEDGDYKVLDKNGKVIFEFKVKDGVVQ